MVFCVVYWLIELSGEPSRKFNDIQQMSGQYYQLFPEFLEKLQNQLQMQPHYHVLVSKIQNVIAPKKNNLTSPFIISLLSNTGLAVTFLGGLTDPEGCQIVGVWPAQFQSVLKTDPKAVINLLYIIIERPEIIHWLELMF